MRIKEEEMYERVSAYARKIRDLRKDHDLTQTQVAKMLHVAQRTYSDYELGYVRIPIEALIELARFYDTDMNYICGLTKQKRPFPK